MTAAGRTAFDLGAATPSRIATGRRIPLGPAEGWTSLFLLALMAALVGWSIDDAAWVLGDQRITDFLMLAGVGGVLAGFTTAKLGWSRLPAHLAGALVGVAVLLAMVGAVLAPGEGWYDQAAATAAAVRSAWFDLVILDRASTTQVGHFLLALGVLCWGTGQFAAFAAIAHRRPVAAVLIPGAVLLANVCLTVRDQFAVLVLYSIAAMLLVVRLHVADEQQAWLRHRIGDVGGAVGVYLRAGLSFVVAVVAGSLVLTSVAAANPLAGFWQDLPGGLVDIGTQLSRLFPAGGPGTRLSPGVAFGTSVTISGSFVSTDSPVLDITVPDDGVYRWRAVAYDRFEGRTWSWSSTREAPVDVGGALLVGTADEPPDSVATRAVAFEVRTSGQPRLVVAPAVPVAVDRASRAILVQQAGEAFFGRIEIGGPGPYRVTAQVPVTDEAVPGALTANRLRAAGAAYPPEIAALYLAIRPGTTGPEAEALLATILARSGAINPYDVAMAIQSYLSDGDNFTYDSNVTDIDCEGRGLVDCFVWSRRGYCQHYASTMVMLLRLYGVPARYVEGYLPGTRDAAGVERITQGRTHAWVEAWFPGYGWVEFDPTGGGQGIQVELPAGPTVAPETPSPSGSGLPLPSPTRRPRPAEPGGGTTALPPASSGGIGPAIVLVILAVPLGLALLAWAWRRRAPRPVEPDAAYRTVERTAGLFGYPPRPTQTVYEYVGGLAETLPVAAPELELVARSKVEATYGRKRLPPDRLRALGAAQRRLRLLLVRLGFRRGRR
jgi:transglutaminase-like putative cysteine protease